MAGVRFEPDSVAIRAFLKSPVVVRALQDAGNTMAERCGNGFGTHTSLQGDRARVYVRAETPRAAARQRRDHLLERALGGGL